MTLYAMRGLPGSGKSTKAKEMVESHGNLVRLNKDLLREMLHFNKWTPKNEEVTHRMARTLAKTLLLSRNVLIDDTNLHPGVMQGWRDLARECDVNFKIVDMTDVPIEECVLRDNARKLAGQRFVGYTVIKNMALRYGLKKFGPGEVVLCDIDGTIADIKHRLHYVKGEKRDWKSFFQMIPLDGLREDVAAKLEAHRLEGKTIVFMSGRPDSHLWETTSWLDWNNQGHYTVIMRRADDHRPDDVVKPEMLKNHFPDLSAIHCVYDDRPCVIRAWQALGLTVHDVGDGVEF